MIRILPILFAMSLAPLQPIGADVALTIYNNDFAVVREQRQMDFTSGLQTVRFTDVAAQIDATSVTFRSITEPATTVLEQNFEFDLVSADKLLQKFIDQKVRVLTQDGSRYEGELMSFDPNYLVLQGGEEADGLLMITRPDNIKDIQFAESPDGLLTRPTLVWQVSSPSEGSQQIEVAYQTRGIEWEATYNAILNQDDTLLDLNGWVTITNRAGATFKEANIKLMAGDVRKEAPPQPMMMESRVAPSAAPPDQFEEKAFFEYHLYTLQRQTTLADNQIKQIELLSANEVPVKKIYRFDSSPMSFYGGLNQRPEVPGTKEARKINVVLELTNREEDKLGMPLPGGLVRLNKRDPDDGSLEFIGEDRIDHTPRNEKITLTVGDAFDIVGETTRTDFKVETGRKMMTESWEIEIRNRKEEKVTVEVYATLFRWSNWEITQHSQDFEKIDAQTILFPVEVEADGEKKVSYTVRYTW